MSKAPGERNMQGLAHLRSRFIKRAEVLCNSKASPEYWEQLATARRTWSERYPEYAVKQTRVAPEQLTEPGTNDRMMNGLFLPRRLNMEFHSGLADPPPLDLSAAAVAVNMRATEARYHWEGEVIRPLCAGFFPIQYFPWSDSLAVQFVSACMLYDPGTIKDHHRENLFPEIVIRPASMPYRPRQDDPMQRARAEGERDYYRDLLLRQLAHDPDMLAEHIRAAEQAGRDRMREEFPDFLVRPWKKRWWYIPLLPSIATPNLREAESVILERSRQLWGDRLIDEQVVALAEEGRPYSEIARTLGVSLGTVRSALRRSQSDTLERQPTNDDADGIQDTDKS